MFAIYAIVNGNEIGWLSAQTIGVLAAVAALSVMFLIISRAVCRRR